MLDALARVYDLDVPERAHLFHLAGVALPVAGGAYPWRHRPSSATWSSGWNRTRPTLIGPRTGRAWSDTTRRTLARFRAEHARRDGDPP